MGFPPYPANSLKFWMRHEVSAPPKKGKLTIMGAGQFNCKLPIKYPLSCLEEVSYFAIKKVYYETNEQRRFPSHFWPLAAEWTAH